MTDFLIGFSETEMLVCKIGAGLKIFKTPEINLCTLVKKIWYITIFYSASHLKRLSVIGFLVRLLKIVVSILLLDKIRLCVVKV